MTQPVTQEDLNRLRRFIDFQAKSLFIQIDDLREKVKELEPIQPIPKKRREVLDKQIDNLNNKISFLETELNKMKKNGRRASNKS